MIAIRLRILLGCLLLSGACDNTNQPTAPSSSPVTYVFHTSSSYPVGHHTVTSRFVLHRGTFSLQYQSPSGQYVDTHSYVGTYSEENGRVTFRFAASGRWDAVGTFNGDSLEVRYNVVMELSDFDNAVYRRSP